MQLNTTNIRESRRNAKVTPAHLSVTCACSRGADLYKLHQSVSKNGRNNSVGGRIEAGKIEGPADFAHSEV